MGVDPLMSTWICVRQRAGPLVKECRYQRPTLRKGDLPSVQREKQKILSMTKGALFRRTPEDRLELMLGLFGWGATVYTLTFNDAQLPHSFQGVRQVWRNFLGAMRRWRKDSFDYVYAIEGRHGDKRFHIQLVLRDADFTLEEVRFLWPGGFVDGEPLLQGPEDSFRRMARYLVKERHDGWVIPLGARTWVASRSLYGKLPAVEKWRAEDGNIPVPNQATWAEENCTKNPFGAYHYAAYITRYTYNNARVRARHRLEI